MRARASDRRILLARVATLLGVAAGGLLCGCASAAAPPPSPTPGSGQLSLPQPGFEPTITIDAPAISRPGTGTAFSVSPGGVWLTARHVVEGCARTAIVVGPGQGVAAEVRIDPRAETAVLITQGGAPALPLASADPLKADMVVFLAGFPGGRPGQVAARLVQPETLVIRGRRARRESVLAWSQGGKADPLPRSLAGLSGAPALDAGGQVIGVTIAQSRRRAQIYTTSPQSLRAALARAHVEIAAGPESAPMTGGSYRRISSDLRRDLRIVPVVCLGS